MKQKIFYNYVLTAANLNTQSIKFKGNFAYVRVGDAMYMYEQDTNNPYNMRKERFVAMAETTDENVPYREENERNGWIKEYSFQFASRKKEDVIPALNELTQYFKDNPVATIDGAKYSFKATHPRFVSKSLQQNGDIELTYAITITADSVETGYFGDESTITLTDSVTNNYRSFIFDTIDINNATGFNPTNQITNENNVGNEPISRKMTGLIDMYYDGTALSKLIYGVLTGKSDRRTAFKMKIVFDSIITEYEFYIETSTITYKKGVVQRMRFNWVEK